MGGYDMWVVAVSSFLATLGFGILFNIKGLKLFLASIGGMIGALVYTICLNLQFHEGTSLFLASVAFSLYSEILARLCHTPVTTFIICALIPLVPGNGMYQTMRLAIEGNAENALQMGLDTLTYAGALALGIIFMSTIMRYLTKRYGRKIKSFSSSV